jgi:hypothetical protein
MGPLSQLCEQQPQFLLMDLTVEIRLFTANLTGCARDKYSWFYDV